MTDLRKAAEDLLEGVEAAIKAGDWKVDGACDLDLAIVRLRQALAQPEWVGLTDEERVSFFTKSQNKFWDWDDGVDVEAFIRAIETKLKEKNGA